MISFSSLTPRVRFCRRANTSVSNRKRLWISTTTWFAPMRSTSSSAKRSSPCKRERPSSTTSVSQKILAVSASAMGSRFCRAVRCANWVLWYACPSSCAVTCAESTLPLQFSSTSERSSTNDMQNAPPTLPSRGSASSHCSLIDRSTRCESRSL